MTNRFPLIPKNLLVELESRFPERSPSPTETHDDLMVRAGAATVTRLLRHHYDIQQRIEDDVSAESPETT
jgi:hypothetical protein